MSEDYHHQLHSTDGETESPKTDLAFPGKIASRRYSCVRLQNLVLYSFRVNQIGSRILGNSSPHDPQHLSTLVSTLAFPKASRLRLHPWPGVQTGHRQCLPQAGQGPGEAEPSQASLGPSSGIRSSAGTRVPSINVPRNSSMGPARATGPGHPVPTDSGQTVHLAFPVEGC